MSTPITILDVKNTPAYLDDVLNAHPEIKNDSQLGRLLKVTRQAVYQYRDGQNMSVLVAVRLAKILGIEPMETISATMARQATNDDEQQFWIDCYIEARR